MTSIDSQHFQTPLYKTHQNKLKIVHLMTIDDSKILSFQLTIVGQNSLKIKIEVYCQL